MCSRGFRSTVLGSCATSPNIYRLLFLFPSISFFLLALSCPNCSVRVCALYRNASQLTSINNFFSFLLIFLSFSLFSLCCQWVYVCVWESVLSFLFLLSFCVFGWIWIANIKEPKVKAYHQSIILYVCPFVHKSIQTTFGACHNFTTTTSWAKVSNLKATTTIERPHVRNLRYSLFFCTWKHLFNIFVCVFLFLFNFLFLFFFYIFLQFAPQWGRLCAWKLR